MTEKLVSNDDTPALQAINTATGAAIFADGTGNTGAGGLAASSFSGIGVHSANHTPSETAIFGINDSPGQQVPDGGTAGAGSGVWGHTRVEKAAGVVGSVEPGLSQAAGVAGISKGGFGVFGRTDTAFAAVHGAGSKNGVWGLTSSAGDSGVFGQNDGAGSGVAGFSKDGIGVKGRGGQLAGQFDGDVEVKGDVRLVGGLDCAETFPSNTPATVPPGTVMAIDSNGRLGVSNRAYDRCVAGVVSGAGDYRPGLILGRPCDGAVNVHIALVGRVYCNVDADHGAVKVGDLLTTSSTPGHAMVAADERRSHGTVIGKALAPLPEGRGIIPILVALQ